MSRSARTQLIIGALGVVAFAVAMTWMLTHRKRGPAELAPIPAPRLGAVKVVGPTGARPHTTGETLTSAESIDFEVEVFDLTFVYVVSAHKGFITVQWEPETTEVWDKGVYAPTWSAENPQGLRFPIAGEFELYVLASPLPIKDIYDWTTDDLSAPTKKCPRCSVTSMHLKVVNAVAVATPADAGAM